MSRNRTLLRGLSGGCALGLLALPLSAMADTTFGLTADVGVTAGTNPFLQGEDAPGGIAGSVAVQPMLVTQTATSRLKIEALARNNSYIEDYGSDLAGSVAVNYQKQASERLSLRVSADFLSSRTALRDRLAQRFDPTDPNAPPQGPLADPSLIGTRLRTDTLRGGGGLTYQPSALDSVTIDASYGLSWTDDRPSSNYRYANGSITYARTLSPRTSLNATVTASTTTYPNAVTGDGYTIAPSVGLSTQLSQSYVLSVSAGATFVHTDIAGGLSENSTSFSGALSLCRERLRSKLCVAASRAVQPTLVGGLSTLTAVSLDYSVRMGAKNNLSITADYTRTDQTALIGSPDLPHYFGGDARFSREFSPRLRGFVTAGVDKAVNSAIERPADVHGGIGIQWIFGSLR